MLGSKAQLKTILRQAPNGIYLTEVRDTETAEFLYYVAKSGHFALTTIHANSAIGVVERLVSLGVSYTDIGADGATNLIMAQRLVKCLCEHCKIPFGALRAINPGRFAGNITLLSQIALQDNEHWTLYVRHHAGCHHCQGTGEKKGRTLVIETIVLDDDDRAFIRQGDMPGWKVKLNGNGFVSIEQQLTDLLKSGQMDVRRLLESS